MFKDTTTLVFQGERLGMVALQPVPVQGELSLPGVGVSLAAPVFPGVSSIVSQTRAHRSSQGSAQPPLGPPQGIAQGPLFSRICQQAAGSPAAFQAEMIMHAAVLESRLHQTEKHHEDKQAALESARKDGEQRRLEETKALMARLDEERKQTDKVNAAVLDAFLGRKVEVGDAVPSPAGTPQTQAPPALRDQKVASGIRMLLGKSKQMEKYGLDKLKGLCCPDGHTKLDQLYEALQAERSEGGLDEDTLQVFSEEFKDVCSEFASGERFEPIPPLEST